MYREKAIVRKGVLPNALIKHGIIEHEFVGVPFIVHTQRK